MKNGKYWLLTAFFAAVTAIAGGGEVYYHAKATQVEETGAAFSAALERSTDAISEKRRLEDLYDEVAPEYKAAQTGLKSASQAVKDVTSSLTTCEQGAATTIRRGISWEQPKACPTTSNSPLVAAYREAAKKERETYSRLGDIRDAYNAAKSKTLDAHAATDAAQKTFVDAVGNGHMPLTKPETEAFVKETFKKFRNLALITMIFAVLSFVMLAYANTDKAAKEKTV